VSKVVGYFVYMGQSPMKAVSDKKKANAEVKALLKLFPDANVWIKPVMAA
jgi:hypothetical protein